MSNASIPARFTYSQWRHGGWYVNEVRYPSGAIGCVSRNYPDGKWRIVCGNHDTTFPTREAAARAEFEIAAARCAAAEAAKAPPAAPVASDPVPADVPCYLAVSTDAAGVETVMGVLRVAEHASAEAAEMAAGDLCERIERAARGAVCYVRANPDVNAAFVALAEAETALSSVPRDKPNLWRRAFDAREDARRKAVKIDPVRFVQAYPSQALAYRHLLPADMVARIEAAEDDAAMRAAVGAPAMVPQASQQQQGQAAPSGFYAFQARGERAPHKPEPRFMGPQERDGITPKTIQAQTVQVRTRAEWYAFHHACRHLARQRMIGGRGGETFIPANICGRMHRLDVSRLSISHRIEGDRVRRVTNGSHIALKASMISARPRRQLIAVELEWAAQYRRNAATEARHGNKHRRGLSIRAARDSIAEARTLATNFNRLPE